MTRTLLRTRGPRAEGNKSEPVEVTGRREPLPTTMLGGLKEEEEDVRIPESVAMWEPTPELKYHSAGAGGGMSVTVLKAFTSCC